MGILSDAHGAAHGRAGQIGTKSWIAFRQSYCRESGLQETGRQHRRLCTTPRCLPERVQQLTPVCCVNCPECSVRGTVVTYGYPYQRLHSHGCKPDPHTLPANSGKGHRAGITSLFEPALHSQPTAHGVRVKGQNDKTKPESGKTHLRLKQAVYGQPNRARTLSSASKVTLDMSLTRIKGGECLIMTMILYVRANRCRRRSVRKYRGNLSRG